MTEEERRQIAYEAHILLIAALYAKGWKKLGEHRHPRNPQALANEG